MAELGALFKKKKKKSFKSKNLNALNKPALATTIRTSIGGRHGLKVLGKKPTIRADAPKPVNLTSLRKEHNGLDIHVKLVGEGGWASEDSKDGKAPSDSQHGGTDSGATASAARQRWERSQQNPRGLTGNWGDDALIEEQQFPGLDGQAVGSKDRSASGRDRNNNDSGDHGNRSSGPARAFRAGRRGTHEGGAGPRPRFPDRDRFPDGFGEGYYRGERPPGGSGYGGRNDRGISGLGDRGGYARGRGGVGNDYYRDSGAGYSRGGAGTITTGYDRGRSSGSDHWADRGAPIRIDHNDPYARGGVTRDRTSSSHSQPGDAASAIPEPGPVAEYGNTEAANAAGAGLPASPMRIARRGNGARGGDSGVDAVIPEYESRRQSSGTTEKRLLFNPATGEMEEVGGSDATGNKDNTNGGRRGGRSRGARGGSNGRNSSINNNISSARSAAPPSPSLSPALSTSVPASSSSSETPATSSAPRESRLMEQLRKKKAEEGRRKHEKENRQRKEKAERKQKRKEERGRRGPRTRGIKFTFDNDARLVNADAWDPSSRAHETLQRMMAAAAAADLDAVTPNAPNAPGPMDAEISSKASPEGNTRAATSRRPVGLSDLSDLAAAATASGSDDMLVGRGDPTGMSVWGPSPRSLSREASPGSSSSQSASSKAAVNKAWADSVPVSLHQSIIGKPSSPTGSSSSSPTATGSTVTSGVVDSSNPYAGAFSSSLQQTFVRATSTEVESTTALSRQSSGNWGSSAGEGDNVSDVGSADASWGQTSTDGINPSATEFVPGGGAGAGEVASIARLPHGVAHMEEPSPTMSPQFSAMRPASDKAEFNVMAFPGSLMGNAMGGLGSGGSRSLLGMQGGDSLMGSNLQAPYQQWSSDRSTSFGYAQQHPQQQQQQILRQEGHGMDGSDEAHLEGQDGGSQGQGDGQRQQGEQRNRGGKSKNRPKKGSRNRNRNQGGGNGKSRGGNGGGRGGGGGGGGGGGRSGRRKNNNNKNGRKNKGTAAAKKN